ncbi:MAG: hypothetical protein ACI4HI_07280, partial [Lachnospiraceae bacterium]
NFASVLEVMQKFYKRNSKGKKGVKDMESDIVFEAFLKFFPEQLEEREGKLRQENEQIKQQNEQMKQQNEKMEQERICCIHRMLNNGETDEKVKMYLHATDEEIQKARQYQAEP